MPDSNRHGVILLCSWILVVFLVTLSGYQLHSQEPQDARIVRERPTDGYFVAFDNQYLVPFKQKIPGSEIEFEMMPVPPKNAASKPFWIGKYEVTWDEYREFAKLGYIIRTTPRLRIDDAHAIDAVTAPTDIYEESFYFGNVTSSDCPAHSVTQYAAKQYTKWLSLITNRSFRLPTEAEWEQACQGSMSGDPTASEYAVFGRNLEEPIKVGSRKPNRLGIYDIFGNVSEWVITETWKDKPSEGAWDPSKFAAPRWVSKGGSVNSPQENLKPGYQEIATWEYWIEDSDCPVSCSWLTSPPEIRVGFRIVCTLDNLDRQAMQAYWDCESPDTKSWVDDRVRTGRVAAGIIDDKYPELNSAARKYAPWQKWEIFKKK